MPRKREKISSRGGARKGAGRPPSDDPTVALAARVPASLVAPLDRWAQRHGLTRSAAVAEAVRRLVGA